MGEVNLRELQLRQLEILKVIKEICDNYNIKFSLIGGTALGAIRHGGFIPWDDDLDIGMSREDYTKFKEICKTALPDRYFFQDYHTDKEFTQCFAKIRDNETTYIELETEDLEMNKGIFVDIFPFDYIPVNKIEVIKQYVFACFNLLLARGVPSKKNGKVMYYIGKGILGMIPNSFKYKIKSYCEDKMIQKNSKKVDKVAFLTSTFEELKKYYPKNLLNEIIEIEFEEEKIPIFKEYDIYLKIQYGDYMKLPPEEDRVCKHKPIYYSTSKSYVQYKKNIR